MDRLLDLQFKLRDTGAALGRLASEVSLRPESRALQSNILSLRKLQQRLQTEFQEEANELGRDVCHYRMLEESPTAKALSAAIGFFQDAFSLSYDALCNGAKSKRLLSPEAAFKTELRVAYAYPGSFGVVLTIPNSRLPMFPEAATHLDQAIETVFAVAKSKGDSKVVAQVARQIGRAPIAAMYDWAKGNARHSVGADIAWLGTGTKKDALVVQAPEFREISDSMERTSEKLESTETPTGVLVGADVKRHTFHFIADGAIVSIRGRFTDAISDSQQAKLPARYTAILRKTTTITYATEREESSYVLVRLEPAPL